MSLPDTVETIAINIDGVDVQVPKGINVDLTTSQSLIQDHLLFVSLNLDH